MDPPDGVTTTDDLTLVRAARAGDRLAFGVLYLRHHAAAWRVACVASRFSPDAELAVIEGFTRVFSALPEESEEFDPGGVTFRPYVLACVRQAALDRARAAGRAEPAARSRPPTSPPPPALLAGLAPDREVVLSSLEHHVARGALAAVPERARTALWLSDVEAMTPGEVAGILGGRPQEMVGLAAAARAEIHAAQQAALGRQEVRAGCRFTVDHLDAYQAGTLDPAEGLIVRSHLDRCPPCRMRQGELANAPAALAGAVPAAPLLGGEAQHHWVTSAGDIQPAERLLPPGLAAGGSVHRPALARRTVARLGTVAGAAVSPARRLPDALRRARRAAAGSWPKPGSIDLTGPDPVASPTVPDSSGSAGSPRATRSPRSTGSSGSGSTGSSGSSAPPDPTSPPGWTGAPGWSESPDPTNPPGWTGAPGWSGSPVPAFPPEWTIPPGRAAGRSRSASEARARSGGVVIGHLPTVVRQVGRTFAPVLPVVSLVVACLVILLAVPRLMTPGTAPGPAALASPAVRAYVPRSPGATPAGQAAGSRPGAIDLSSGGRSARLGGTEFAAPRRGGPGTTTAASNGGADGNGGTAGGQPSVGLIATAASRPSGFGRPDRPDSAGHHGARRAIGPPGGAGGPAPALVPVTVAATTNPVTVAATTTSAAPTLTPTPVVTASKPDTSIKPESSGNPGSSAQPTKPGNPGSTDEPADPGKPGKSEKPNKPEKPNKAEKPAKSEKPAKPEVPGTPKKPIPPVAPPKLEMPSTQWNWATVPDWPGLPTAGKAGRPSVRPGPTAGTGAQNGGSTNKRAVPRARIVTA